MEGAGEPAQDLVLEYAEGWPMAQVGWGRATAADLEAISAVTVLQFKVGSRPAYTARLNDAAVVARMVSALDDADGPKVSVIVAHDGNIASLAGLLDLHWRVPGVAPDYPVPGEALGFERLSDSEGKLYVRAIYRGQTLEQIRSLAPLGPGSGTYQAVLPIPGCRARDVEGLCSLEQFERLIQEP